MGHEQGLPTLDLAPGVDAELKGRGPHRGGHADATAHADAHDGLLAKCHGAGLDLGVEEAQVASVHKAHQVGTLPAREPQEAKGCAQLGGQGEDSIAAHRNPMGWSGPERRAPHEGLQLRWKIHIGPRNEVGRACPI